MHQFLAIFMGGRGGNWFDLVLLPLAAVLVFPDSTLEWLSDRGVRMFSEWSPFKFRVAALLAITGFSVFLAFSSTKFFWWWPLVLIGILLVFRAVRLAIKILLGIRDD